MPRTEIERETNSSSVETNAAKVKAERDTKVGDSLLSNPDFKYDFVFTFCKAFLYFLTVRVLNLRSFYLPVAIKRPTKIRKMLEKI